MICGIMPLLWASDGCDQHLSPEEFRAKQKAFITEKAGLTSEEAAKFFPLYFELQDRKKQLNDEAWKLLRQGKDEKTTEAQYEEIMEGVYDRYLALAWLNLYFSSLNLCFSQLNLTFRRIILFAFFFQCFRFVP